VSQFREIFRRDL